jgi:hypothetical protein
MALPFTWEEGARLQVGEFELIVRDDLAEKLKNEVRAKLPPGGE